MNFANNLKQLRNQRNLTLQEMGDLLSISRQAYSKYENGEAEPSYQNLVILAEYFQVSTDYLLGKDITPNSEKDEELKIFLNKIQDIQSELDELKIKFNTFYSIEKEDK